MKNRSKSNTKYFTVGIPPELFEKLKIYRQHLDKRFHQEFGKNANYPDAIRSLMAAGLQSSDSEAA